MPPPDALGNQGFLPAGTLILWHQRLVHAAGWNRSRRVRQAVLRDFSRVTLPGFQVQPRGGKLWAHWAAVSRVGERGDGGQRGQTASLCFVWNRKRAAPRGQPAGKACRRRSAHPGSISPLFGFVPAARRGGWWLSRPPLRQSAASPRPHRPRSRSAVSNSGPLPWQ